MRSNERGLEGDNHSPVQTAQEAVVLLAARALLDHGQQLPTKTPRAIPGEQLPEHGLPSLCCCRAEDEDKGCLGACASFQDSLR